VSGELQALRELLTRGGEPPEGAGGAGALRVVRRPGGGLDHVRVTLTGPVELADLARHFGPPRLLPSTPTGGRRALFPQTSPGDGQRATTVLAELDDAGRARVVVLRPDDLR
jgi:hypothetical protein